MSHLLILKDSEYTVTHTIDHKQEKQFQELWVQGEEKGGVRMVPELGPVLDSSVLTLHAEGDFPH